MSATREHREAGRLARPVVRVLVSAGAIVLCFLLMFGRWMQEVTELTQTQQAARMRQLVHISRAALAPIIHRVDHQELDRSEAVRQAAEHVRRMLYVDRNGLNYVFMGTYDGYLWAQPYRPELEGTDQWGMVDTQGKYIIRELVAMAQRQPEGGFVTYLYPVPGSGEIQQKLTFVIGIPELGCFLGTGTYLAGPLREQQGLLRRARAWSIAFLLLVLVPIGISLAEVVQRNAQLATEMAERKQAEEQRLALERQLLHAQKLESLGLMAGGVAHDFNNILAVVLGHADLARLLVPDGSEAQASIDDIIAAGVRATGLCRQMLAYSGRGRFVDEPVDLSVEVRQMVDILRATTAKTAQLEMDLAEGLPAVLADASQIQQVVLNLVVNAAEAVKGHGLVSIATGEAWCTAETLRSPWSGESLEAGRYVWLEVADNGVGMDEETQQRIFDPFFSTKFTGRGLGLAAVLGIVRGHRGTVLLDSAPGRGTTFRVLFPATDRPVSAPAAVPEGLTAWSDGGKILVVDDDDLVRDVAGRILATMGFTPIPAGSGPEAVATWREQGDDIDCVLLDLTMPGMSGAEVFRAIRELSPQARIILTSGYDEQEATRDLVGQGLAAFHQKPYLAADLAATLRAVLSAPTDGALTK